MTRYTAEELMEMQDEDRIIVLPVAPNTVLYELKGSLMPMDDDSGFVMGLLIEEKRICEEELLRISEQSLYGMGKTVFHTFEEAMTVAKQIQDRGIEIYRVKCCW